MFPRQPSYGKTHYWPFSPALVKSSYNFIYYPLKMWLPLCRWKRRSSRHYYFPRATSWSLHVALEVPFRLIIIPRKININYFFKQKQFFQSWGGMGMMMVSEPFCRRLMLIAEVNVTHWMLTALHKHSYWSAPVFRVCLQHTMKFLFLQANPSLPPW